MTDTLLLRKRVEFWSFDEIDEHWEDEFERWHHFSFFWTSTDESAPQVFLDCPDDIDMADHGYVKMFDGLPPGDFERDGQSDESGTMGRSYELYLQYCGPISTRWITWSRARQAGTRSARCGG